MVCKCWTSSRGSTFCVCVCFPGDIFKCYTWCKLGLGAQRFQLWALFLSPGNSLCDTVRARDFWSVTQVLHEDHVNNMYVEKKTSQKQFDLSSVTSLRHKVLLLLAIKQKVPSLAGWILNIYLLFFPPFFVPQSQCCQFYCRGKRLAQNKSNVESVDEANTLDWVRVGPYVCSVGFVHIWSR